MYICSVTFGANIQPMHFSTSYKLYAIYESTFNDSSKTFKLLSRNRIQLINSWNQFLGLGCDAKLQQMDFHICGMELNEDAEWQLLTSNCCFLI